ncbi:hypothetical protein SPF06_19760 [Sinomonas sp. JGH33]|uniref:Uncharacterized protein n=1 Tax=Sinomonas terricola TaxID=3110330 RepID=A0ABU5TBS3_9MICC|nr:hypothetical protein [Sinomonas sp. JGH33]MEA5456965.1 hypothetical protein [Sinomonas sp. JGH33]
MMTALPAVLGHPEIGYATDWNADAWAGWWTWASIAMAGVIALPWIGRALGRRLYIEGPEGVAYLVAAGGFVFVIVASMQMFRHAPSGDVVWQLFFLYAGFALALAINIGILTGELYGWARRLAVGIPSGLLGGFLVCGGINEWVTRSAASLGITAGGFLILVAAVAAIGIGYAFSRR